MRKQIHQQLNELIKGHNHCDKTHVVHVLQNFFLMPKTIFGAVHFVIDGILCLRTVCINFVLNVNTPNTLRPFQVRQCERKMLQVHFHFICMQFTIFLSIICYHILIIMVTCKDAEDLFNCYGEHPSCLHKETQRFFFFNYIKVEILLKVYTWLKHYYGIYGKKRSWTDGWINE